MTDSNVIGYVSKHTGEATLTKINGEVVELGIFSQIHKNDLIESTDGTRIEIVMENGNVVNIQGQRTLLVDETVYEAKAFKEDEISKESVDLAEDGDISQLEETEAGEQQVGTSQNIGDAFTNRGGDDGFAQAEGLSTSSILSQDDENLEELDEDQRDSLSPNAPFINPIALGNDDTPTITGQAERDSEVSIIIDGELIAVVVTDANGEWSYTPDSLSDGEHTVTAISTDAAGNSSDASQEVDFIIDTQAPDAPTINDLDSTNDTSPTITGEGEAGSTITISVDGKVVGETTANENAEWTYTLEEALSEGEHEVNATSTDKAGNTSSSSKTKIIEIDISLDDPNANDDDINIVTDDGVMNEDESKNVELGGTTEPGSTVEIIITDKNEEEIKVEVIADEDGNWGETVDISDLEDGDIDFEGSVTDPTGNTTELEGTTVIKDTIIDDVNPNDDDIQVGAGDDNIINDKESSELNLEGTTEPGSTVEIIITDENEKEIKVQIIADEEGNWSETVDISDLEDGDIAFEGSVTDPAGNTSTLDGTTIIKDTVVEGQDLIVKTDDGIINDEESKAVELEGQTEPGSSVEIIITDEENTVKLEVIADENGNWSETVDISDLVDGDINFEGSVTDPAGNTKQLDGITVIKDTVINDVNPDDQDIQIETGNDNILNKDESSSVVVSGTTEANATISIIIKDEKNQTVEFEATADENGNWSETVDLSALDDGEIEAVGSVTDPAGNTQTLDETVITKDTTLSDADNDNGGIPISIDGISPDTGVQGDFTTNENEVRIYGTYDAETDNTLEVTINGVTQEVNVDGKNWSVDFEASEDASYAIVATLTDDAGNSVEVQESLIIDTTAEGSGVTINLNEVSDGYINADEADETLNISGSTTAMQEDSIVSISVNGADFTTATVDADGNFSVDIDASIIGSYADGPYTLTATVVADAAGNTVSDSQEVVLDTSNDDNNGNGNTLTGEDANITLNQISDNFINKDESENEEIVISGTTTALDGSTVTIKVNGNEFAEVNVVDGGFSYAIAAGIFAGYEDGTYEVSAEVVADLAGNIASDTQSVVLDRVLSDDNDNYDNGVEGSLVSIDTISEDTGVDNNDFITSDATLLIQGTFDNEVGNHLEVSVDGVVYNVEIDGQDWSLDLQNTSLSNGDHTIVATISDEAGNTQSVEQNVTIDTTPASADAIVLDEISNNYINGSEIGETLEISGSVGSGSENGDSVSIEFNGQIYNTTIEEGRFSVEVPSEDLAGLVDGNTYTATATTSTATQTVSDTEDVIVDLSITNSGGNNGVLVSIDSITEDTGSSNSDFITNDTSLIISGSFDNVDGNSLSVTIGGALYTPTITGNAWNIDLQDTNLSDAGYEIVATITDLAGNSSTVNQTIVVDTGNNGDDGNGTGEGGKDAIISLNEISDNYINAREANGETISITGTSTALNGNIVTIRVDGNVFGTAEVTDGAFSLDIPAGTFDGYEDGTYIVSAEVAADLAGNLATDSESVILDRDANGDDGNGTGIGGKDATITLDEVSDNYINQAESSVSIRVTGTTTAVEGTLIVISFNGQDFSTVATANQDFSVDILAGDLVDGSIMTVNASVVADKAGNLAYDSEDVNIDLSAGILSNINSSVNESALDIGSNPSIDGRSVSGNILEGQSNTEGSSISGLNLEGQEATIWDENSDILVISTNEGTLYLATSQTTQDGVTYNEGDYVYTLENAGSNAQESFSFTLTDEAGNTSNADLNISIVDDVAVGGASVDKFLNADDSHVNVTNLVLTLDVSGSMAWDANGNSSSSWYFDESTVRLDLAKEALTNLINTYADQGEVNVNIVAFSSSASDSGWLSATDAITYINSLDANGGTMYDNAITEVETIAGTPESDDSFFYFISDGEPNNGGALTISEQSTWENYADSNYDKTFAIGMGTSVNLSALEAIGGAADTQIISSATDLDAALLSTISTVSGSLLGFDVDGTVISLGADGGRIDSVEIDGNTYDYANYNNENITTELGGSFVIDFDTGSYSYTVGINTDTQDEVETLSINATSNDGENVSGELVLHLQESENENLVLDTAGLDGGSGFDTLVLQGTESINFANVDNIKNIESINLTTGDHELLNISAADVLDMTDANNTLTILGDEGDSVSLEDSSKWTQTQTSEDGHNFTVYSSTEEDVTLKIETEIPVV